MARPEIWSFCKYKAFIPRAHKPEIEGNDTRHGYAGGSARVSDSYDRHRRHGDTTKGWTERVRVQQYEKNILSLFDAVAMGIGAMIGAGILALTGQIAEMAGPWFPLAFAVGAMVTGFSAYTYVKMSNAWPSEGQAKTPVDRAVE